MSTTVDLEKLEDLSVDDLRLLNTKVGLRNLFRNKRLDVRRALRYTKYEEELKRLQAELVFAQDWIIKNGKKLVVIFEGRDAAGKGGAIRRIATHINPRFYNIVALPKPSEEEKGQWYFQRYINLLPKRGQIVFFDRSWYNRAVIEPVNSFCTQEEYKRFMGQVNEFERMIVESDTILLKIYLSISKTEQKRRFEEIKSSNLKKWKMTPLDEKAQVMWDQYSDYKQRMFDKTDTELVPWKIVDADRKTSARLESLSYILSNIPYKS